MKKPLLLMALLCLSTSVFAQGNDNTEIYPNENVRLITFNLLAPFAFDTPRYRLGYTHGISGHLRAGLEIGYGSESTTFTVLHNDPNDRDNYSLIEFLPQLTYVFNPTYPVNHFIAIQGIYLNHNERIFNDSYFDTDLRLEIAYDQAEYNRKKFGANLLYGVYIPFGNAPLGMEISTGLGIRSRENSYSNLINPRANDIFDNDDGHFLFRSEYREDSGTRVGVNFSLGFKLTYNINN